MIQKLTIHYFLNFLTPAPASSEDTPTSPRAHAPVAVSGRRWPFFSSFLSSCLGAWSLFNLRAKSKIS